MRLRLLAIAVVAYTSAVAHAQQPQPTPTPATPPGAAVPSTPAPARADAPRGEPTKPPSTSSAEPTPKKTAEAEPKKSAEPAPAPQTKSSEEMNFDLFGNEQKKSPLDEAREKERVAKLEKRVGLRRQLLQWHQALGFVTLGLLAITDIIGTLNYYDKYASNGVDTGKYSTWHEGLGIGTASLFGVTGILALAAPNPYPKPLKLDAALIHKVTMALATACFVAQVIMGPIMAVSDGKLYQRDLALAHVVIGWGAFGFMGAGTLAFVF
jgi:cytochrome b561